MNQPQSRYRWYILALVVMTDMFVVAFPSMGLSVLTKEISQSLGLSVVQVGMIWGASFLPGIFTNLLGGVIGDMLGPKRVLVATTLLAGLLGAARGLAQNYAALMVIVILWGGMLPFIMMNGFKTASQWFPPQQLGRANGMISIGMALGFLLGALWSATVFSPLLGGWRNVLIVYGLLAALLSIPWLFSRAGSNSAQAAGGTVLFREAIRHVAGIKDIWLLGLGLFGVAGAVQGLLGYLPLYLRNIGWQPASADGALSAFHTVSLVFVLPIALWSDRLGSRKQLLIATALMSALGIGVLSVASGAWIWVGVVLAGFVRDGFMALFVTMTVETERVGPRYAGTAAGFALALSNIGQLAAPPFGNSLASIWPGAPFAFWSGLTLLGIVILALTRQKKSAAVVPVV